MVEEDASKTPDSGSKDDTRRQWMRQIFTSMDANGDGVLQLSELRAFLIGCGYTEEEADRESLKIVTRWDQNGDAVISFDEFMDSQLIAERGPK